MAQAQRRWTIDAHRHRGIGFDTARRKLWHQTSPECSIMTSRQCPSPCNQMLRNATTHPAQTSWRPAAMADDADLPRRPRTGVQDANRHCVKLPSIQQLDASIRRFHQEMLQPPVATQPLPIRPHNSMMFATDRLYPATLQHSLISTAQASAARDLTTLQPQVNQRRIDVGVAQTAIELESTMYSTGPTVVRGTSAKKKTSELPVRRRTKKVGDPNIQASITPSACSSGRLVDRDTGETVQPGNPNAIPYQSFKNRRRVHPTTGEAMQPRAKGSISYGAFLARRLVDASTGKFVLEKTPNTISYAASRKRRLVDRHTGDSATPGDPNAVPYSVYQNHKPVDPATGQSVEPCTPGAMTYAAFVQGKNFVNPNTGERVPAETIGAIKLSTFNRRKWRQKAKQARLAPLNKNA